MQEREWIGWPESPRRSGPIGAGKSGGDAGGDISLKATGRILTSPPERGPRRGPRPQHVARPRWSGAFLNFSTSFAAADRAYAASKWLRPRRRDGPRSGSGGFTRPGRPAWRKSCQFSDTHRKIIIMQGRRQMLRPSPQRNGRTHRKIRGRAGRRGRVTPRLKPDVLCLMTFH